MNKRILFVDDEPMVLQGLQRSLRTMRMEWETKFATSGPEALEMMAEAPFDVVITDMRMESDAAGREVVEAARAAKYHPAIAMLTAFPLADEDWQAMGADKMLVKPMHTRILLQQIETLLASHEAKLSIWSTPAPKAVVAPAAKKAAKAPAKKVAKKVVKKVVKKADAKKAKRK